MSKILAKLFCSSALNWQMTCYKREKDVCNLFKSLTKIEDNNTQQHAPL